MLKPWYNYLWISRVVSLLFWGEGIFPCRKGYHHVKKKKAVLFLPNISSVQSLSCIWLFAAPWTAAFQASLSITNFWSFLKFMSIELVMPLSWWCHPTISSFVVPFSSHLQSFSASGSFPMSQPFPSGGQSIGASASASVFPMNIQDWFPFGWTGWISLQSKGLSRVFSNTTVQKHQFFGAQLHYGPTLISIHDYRKTIALTRWIFVRKVMSLFFHMLSRS